MTHLEGMALILRLEKEIDAHGLYAVMEALRDVTNEKAEHVRTNWGDEALAKEWDKANRVLERAGTRIGELGVLNQRGLL